MAISYWHWICLLRDARKLVACLWRLYVVLIRSGICRIPRQRSSIVLMNRDHNAETFWLWAMSKLQKCLIQTRVWNGVGEHDVTIIEVPWEGRYPSRLQRDLITKPVHMESVHYAIHKGMEHEQANELGTTILRVIEKIISVKFPRQFPLPLSIFKL